jgi:hypothetical protein
MKRREIRMNGYQAVKKMFKIDSEMQRLGEVLLETEGADDRKVLEDKIDRLDVEFIELKHKLEKVEII